VSQQNSLRAQFIIKNGGAGWRHIYACRLLKIGLQLFSLWLGLPCLLDKLAYSGHGKSSGERGSVMI
jgi:hypothetical protein